MRIGYLSLFDSNDATRLSGMPYHMREALEARGHHITPIAPQVSLRARSYRALRTRVAKVLPRSVKDVLREVVHQLTPEPPELGPGDLYAQFLADAARTSNQLAALVDPTAYDLLFGCCISVPLYALETSLPIVYFSDTTARLINASYPRYRDLPAEYHQATDDVERTAMGRADAVVTATALAQRSAINDYGVPPEHAHVIAMGANVEPGTVAWSPPEPPTRASLRLVITAADPVRKQLDLAVETVALLRAAGIGAELDAIGGTTPAADASPWVRCHGYLKLSDPADRRRNLGLLAASHLMILPSLGEAFGIATCEAANVGRPSIVSDAGGLPEAVLDDETGIVLPITATAADYATALIALVNDPERYRRLSAEATRRAHEELCWSHWAERIEAIFEQVLANRRLQR